MRVAVLADIHGNLPALDAVLADVEISGADAIVLNGDMATGPMPAQTLERLAGLRERAVWVRGNCERELADAWDGSLDPSLPEQVRVPAEYCAAQLERAHRDLLDGLPLSVTLEVDGLGPVRFCHATAVSDTAIVLVDSPVASYRAGSPASASRPWCSATRICRSTASPTAAGSSTREASACRTGRRVRTGRCSDPRSPCGAPVTTRRRPRMRCARPRRDTRAWMSSSRKTL